MNYLNTLRKIYNYTLFIICFFLFLHEASAQAVRKYSNEFLKIGVGAKGLALSNAQVAGVDDINSVYYNPAGLTQITRDVDLGLMHAEYFGSIAKYDFAGVAFSTKNKTQAFGLSYIRFGIDNIPNTLELYNPDGTIDYDKVRSFSVADAAINFSYAAKISKIKGLSVGGNAKIIRRRYGNFGKAWGFGIDAGVQYQRGNFRLGAMAHDVTGTFSGWSFSFTDAEKATLQATNNEIPESSLEITLPMFRVGSSYQFKNKSGKFVFTPELDFDITTDGRRNVLFNTAPWSIDANLGMEFGLWKVFFIRTGFGKVQRSTDDKGNKITTFQPNLGAGLKIKAVNLDYAYTDVGNQSGGLYSHVVSLGVQLNKRKK